MGEAGTMKVRGSGCVIQGEDGASPPLPYITVSKSEGKVLIAQKLAVEVDGAEPEAEAAPAAPEGKPKRQRGRAASPHAPAPEAPKPDADEGEGAEGGEGEERATNIAEALDLIDGDATVEAVAEVTGYEDVTEEEIAAVKAAKDAAE